MTLPRLCLPLLLLTAVTACVPVAQPQAPAVQVEAPPAPLVEADAAPPVPQLVQQKCSGCHGLDIALSGPRSAGDWASVLDTMVGHGMVASAEELRAIQAYLATHHSGETE